MIIYPDDRVLIAVMNNLEDWRRVQTEQWYRIPVKNAPQPIPHVDWLAFFFTKTFGPDKWAIHYYAKVEGHELVRRRDLLKDTSNSKKADAWYYKLDLGPLLHKIPPIIADKWRRVSFIFTTGDRFEAAGEIKDLLADYSPTGHPFVVLKELPEVFEGEEKL